MSLGKDQETVEKYRAYELLHARWAMLAAAGIVIPEGLQANGADIYGGTWFETGAEMLNGGTLNYFAVPWGVVNNPLPLAAVTAIEVVLMGAVERFRYKLHHMLMLKKVCIVSNLTCLASHVAKFEANAHFCIACIWNRCL